MTASTDARTTRTDGVPAHAARTIEDVARLALADVPARPLTQGELLELAASIAADPEVWRPAATAGADDGPDDAPDGGPGDGARHYVNLHRDEHVDVWVLGWTPVADTGWHDHDVSSGAVAVVAGALVEHNLVLGGGPGVATEIPAGQVYSFGPDHIHRLTGRDDGSVSVHVYSPPLVTMGQYAIDPATGLLHRTPVSYTEELRATEAP